MSRVVLVTGATSGFGQGVASLFAQEGYAVIASGRRKDRLDELCSKFSNIYPLVMDVQERNGVFEAIASLPDELKNIDILVNNAGLALGLEGANEANLDDWDTMIDTNIKGLLYVTKAVLPQMKERKSGYIFNISSIAANWPYLGANVYGSTKAFVKQFSLNLRNDLRGTNIRVTNIEPGFAQTEFSLVRFKGDKQKADAIYDGIEALTSEDIAKVILSCVNLPLHVNINTLEVMPTAQTWAGFHFDKN